jgi:ATP-dependent DNA helicase DinG
MTGYLYLENSKRFKQGLFLPPVFNYEKQVKTYICSDVPNLYQDQFVPVILGRIKQLMIDLGGRSLLLFSSKVRFEQAREWLLKEFEAKLPIYIQGMGSNVVDEFKRAHSGILIGMEAFGEGIDIPGDDLQFLLIDKIPDLRQDLVIDARRDFYERNFGNEFYDYFMAHRTRSLHQKIGRLIRRSTDRGCAIIVDSRISKWKGNTLSKFKQLMLPYQIEFKPMDQAVDAVKKFLVADA